MRHNATETIASARYRSGGHHPRQLSAVDKPPAPTWLDSLDAFARTLPKTTPLDWFQPANGMARLRRLAQYSYRVRSLAPWFQATLRWTAALWWPVRAGFLVREVSEETAARVRAHTGKGAARQWLERYWLALRYGIEPEAYGSLALCEPAGFRDVRYYVTQALHHRLMDLLNDPASTRYLTDKLAFYRLLRGRLPIPDLLAVFRAGREWRIDDLTPWPPRGDLFVKESAGLMGRNAMLWTEQEQGWFRNSEGVVLSAEALHRLLSRRSLHSRSSLIVQRLERNHPAIADLSPGPVCNARIVSALVDDGDGARVEFLGAIFKMPVGTDVTTNHGLGAAIDLQTGCLGLAFDSDDFLVPDRTTHPDTGAEVTGRRLPFWSEALGLVEQAHRMLPGVTLIGWDVVFTERGAVLLEGNIHWAIANLQRAMRRPLGRTRYPEICLRRLATRPTDMRPAAP